MTSCVVIEKADEAAFNGGYVVLPSSFGTEAYDEREDVRAIRKAVESALTKLDEKTGFTKVLASREKVIIKPNLVSVYHDSGFDERDYPETTDPRVFEAVVRFVKRCNENIVIAESSGKPMPTGVSFRTAGYDRIASFYKTELVALETRPVVRYMLPKAEVMKEVYLPDTLDDAVKGKAFYISVPKMKTNLYTGVTLGFKNAMGTIPYFLRERNHSYLINKKLADLLYLFKPDLTIVDGIIGGEGNTPAPVDPVRVGRIIAGTNSVETDRITTRMMGFDPEEILLMKEAKARGFGDADVTVVGDPVITPFRPAVSSFMDDKTSRDFPNLLALAGHTVNGAPEVTDPSRVDKATALALEQACSGGCLAAAKTGLDYYNYSGRSRKDFALCIVMGEGILIDGTRWWFDKTGKAYSLEDIKALPHRKAALGNCAGTAKEACGFFAPGCCDPASCMSVICRAAGVRMPIMSLRNRSLAKLSLGMISTVLIRRRYIRNGLYVDCPHAQEDRIFGIPDLCEEDREKDHIAWPLPPMSSAEKRRQLRDQWKILLSALNSGKRNESTTPTYAER